MEFDNIYGKYFDKVSALTLLLAIEEEVLDPEFLFWGAEVEAALQAIDIEWNPIHNMRRWIEKQR